MKNESRSNGEAEGSKDGTERSPWLAVSGSDYGVFTSRLCCPNKANNHVSIWY